LIQFFCDDTSHNVAVYTGNTTATSDSKHAHEKELVSGTYFLLYMITVEKTDLHKPLG